MEIIRVTAYREKERDFVKRTYEEINARIAKGDAVVMTAEEVIDLVRVEGVERAAEEVDVVTTRAGAGCSSK